MNPVIVDANGEAAAVHDRSAKQIMFDWSGVIAVAMAAITWGYYSNKLETQGDEIDKLRAANDARMQYDLNVTREMATKQDLNSAVSRLETSIQGLAAEWRTRK